MKTAGFMSMEKLKGVGIIKVAARHNRREIAAEMRAGGNIDPARSLMNVRLAGPDSAQGVADLAHELMRAAGIDKLRKNAVPALEFLFSLPAGHSIDGIAYFRDCVAWVATRFGGEANILSADVHFDEAQPHCHVLLLPMRDGTLQGSDMYGGPRELEDHQKSFHEAVAARYGLGRASAKLTGAARQQLAMAVLQRLRDAQDPVLQSAVWSVIRDMVERDPKALAMALGIQPEVAPASPARSFSDIMTSTGKGAKTHAAAARRDAALMAQYRDDQRNPIGFEASGEGRTLSCVGFAPETESRLAPVLPHVDEEIGQKIGTGIGEKLTRSSMDTARDSADEAAAATSPMAPPPAPREAATSASDATVEDQQAPAAATGPEVVKLVIPDQVLVNSDAVCGSVSAAVAIGGAVETHARMQPGEAATDPTCGEDEQVPTKYTRERESEQPSAGFCDRTGEYRAPLVVERHARRAADLDVARMLAMRGLPGP